MVWNTVKVNFLNYWGYSRNMVPGELTTRFQLFVLLFPSRYFQLEEQKNIIIVINKFTYYCLCRSHWVLNPLEWNQEKRRRPSGLISDSICLWAYKCVSVNVLPGVPFLHTRWQKPSDRKETLCYSKIVRLLHNGMDFFTCTLIESSIVDKWH